MADEELLKVLVRGAETWNKFRRTTKSTSFPDLSGVHLKDIDLGDINLALANIKEAKFENCFFHNANFVGSNLVNTALSYCQLINCDFTQARMTGAIINGSIIGLNIFGDNDLSDVGGLDTCKFIGENILGHKTLMRSKDLSEYFLRNSGLPDDFIDFYFSIHAKALQFSSCFISHSSKNKDISEKIYSDLQSNGVRCWFAPEDMIIGSKLRVAIDKAIVKYDKLLLVISKDSIESQWVEQEVEKALQKERQEKRLVLVPIRIDNNIFDIDEGWSNLLTNTRHIGDFRNWKDKDSYKRKFAKLLKALREEEEIRK